MWYTVLRNVGFALNLCFLVMMSGSPGFCIGLWMHYENKLCVANSSLRYSHVLFSKISICMQQQAGVWGGEKGQDTNSYFRLHPPCWFQQDSHFHMLWLITAVFFLNDSFSCYCMLKSIHFISRRLVTFVLDWWDNKTQLPVIILVYLVQLRSPYTFIKSHCWLCALFAVGA